MKKLLLTFVTLLLVGFGNTYASNNSTTNNYTNRLGNSFTFVENGITFSIFQNGEFDFYLNQRNNFNANYYNNGINISFNAGYNYDAYVQYDRFGAVIQIENTPIYYDYYGRISQVGSININYSNGRLVRLGGMNIFYNYYGDYAYYRGYVNSYNRSYVYHPYHNYFTRPYYDYRVVSYKPYRNHYKAKRYDYHRDHSKNKYYSKNNYKKRGNNNKHNNYKSHTNRQRVATNAIPKRRENNIATNSRNYVKATELFKKERGNFDRATTSSHRKTASVQHRNTERTATDRSTKYTRKPAVSNNTNSRKSPINTTERRSTISNQRPKTTSNSRVKSSKRSPSKDSNKRTENTRSRRSL